MVLFVPNACLLDGNHCFYPSGVHQKTLQHRDCPVCSYRMSVFVSRISRTSKENAALSEWAREKTVQDSLSGAREKTVHDRECSKFSCSVRIVVEEEP